MALAREAKADLIRRIRQLHRAGKPLNYSAVRSSQGQMLVHARQQFGTWRQAVVAAGIDYDGLSLIQRWSKPVIVRQLQDLRRSKSFSDIRSLSQEYPKLYQACIRHYGSGRSALKAAGIDYQELLGEHPYRWTRKQIVAEIQRRMEAGKTLCRMEILRNEPRMKRFCYAATHQFGNWSKALRAAGLNPDRIRNRDGMWPRERVLTGIRRRYEQGKFLNTDLMLRDDLPLHAAGRRHFGTWKEAIEKAGINYRNVRGGLRGWTKPKTRRALQDRMSGGRINPKQLLETAPSLYRAAIHHFGSWESALREARRKK